jgi:glycolate oxidase FAD binding subunit
VDLMDLKEFANEVGTDGEVAVAGSGSRGPRAAGVRTVRAPAGILELSPAEMTVRCGAGTTMADLAAALSEAGQFVALPVRGTVGGALATADSVVTRLRHGPARDTVLQIRYISARGEVIRAGGPTVKNVSGFDLCRLLVGSYGTLGFMGEVILRTKPVPAAQAWFASVEASPELLLRTLYRPAALLWDGSTTWVCLEGHPRDVEGQARLVPGAVSVAGPPTLPTGGRWSVPPSQFPSLSGKFVAEVGVGVVHHDAPPPVRSLDQTIVALHRAVKRQFDPSSRLNPGVDVLRLTTGR